MYLIFLLNVASFVVLAEPGDRVEADEAIAQIETDKVSINYLLYYLHVSFFPQQMFSQVSGVAFIIIVFDSFMLYR